MPDAQEDMRELVSQADARISEILATIDATPLTVVENVEFRDQAVYLDGRHFKSCSFINCRLLTALGRFLIDDPRVIDGIDIVTAGVVGGIHQFLEFFQVIITHEFVTAADAEDSTASWRALFNQIRWAVNSNAYYLGLYASLTLPDICGAMSSDNGWATKDKYVSWFDKYVGPRYSGNVEFTGEDCYAFRCSLLHTGSTQTISARYSRILFVEPSPTNRGIRLHRNRMNDALNLDVRVFCNDILDGAER